MNERSTEFVALGHAGSEHYAGIETFPNPGVARVEMTSDELVAMCPITNQPDMYVATIEYEPEELCIESKSLKLYLWGFRDRPVFAEARVHFALVCGAVGCTVNVTRVRAGNSRQRFGAGS